MFVKSHKKKALHRNIDYTRKFLYIHIPKVAGTAIKKGLGFTGGGHAKYHQFESALGENRIKKFFKFTFVRNPWDRFLSYYLYVRMEENYYHSNKNPEKALFGKNNHYDLLINASLVDCAHYLIEGRFKPLKGQFYFMAPQCDWIQDKYGNVAVDFIGKYETINEDFIKLSDRLNLQQRTLEAINASNRKEKDFRDYYSEEAKGLVAKYYERDIDQFKYTFE